LEGKIELVFVTISQFLLGPQPIRFGSQETKKEIVASIRSNFFINKDDLTD
jgi:hypothetical protein